MSKKSIIKYRLKDHNKAWNPLFKDAGNWLFGFFKPKTSSIKDYDYLEKHKYPELFILLTGRIVMTFKRTEKSPIEKMELRKYEAVIFNCWHNGYALEKGSTALVIERPKNPTKHIKI